MLCVLLLPLLQLTVIKVNKLKSTQPRERLLRKVAG
jgi:hypothetical protein